MPCPYFEPQNASKHAEYRTARLPLFNEYDGLCRAGDPIIKAPEPLRFRCCNHGYSRGICERFPPGEQRSSLRYTLTRRTETEIHVLCVEEEHYAPARWYEVKFSIAEALVEPEISDPCVRAQILAFCRGYLERFGD